MPPSSVINYTPQYKLITVLLALRQYYAVQQPKTASDVNYYSDTDIKRGICYGLIMLRMICHLNLFCQYNIEWLNDQVTWIAGIAGLIENAHLEPSEFSDSTARSKLEFFFNLILLLQNTPKFTHEKTHQSNNNLLESINYLQPFATRRFILNTTLKKELNYFLSGVQSHLKDGDILCATIDIDLHAMLIMLTKDTMEFYDSNGYLLQSNESIINHLGNKDNLLNNNLFTISFYGANNPSLEKEICEFNNHIALFQDIDSFHSYSRNATVNEFNKSLDLNKKIIKHFDIKETIIYLLQIYRLDLFEEILKSNLDLFNLKNQPKIIEREEFLLNLIDKACFFTHNFVSILIKYKIDLNIYFRINNITQTLLYFAVQMNDDQACLLLSNYIELPEIASLRKKIGAEIEVFCNGLLQKCTEKDRLATLQVLLKSKRFNPYLSDYKYNYAVILAIKKGNYLGFKEFLDNYPDLISRFDNIMPNKKNYLLQIAIDYNQPEIAELILNTHFDSSTDINLLNRCSDSPDQIEVLKVLLQSKKFNFYEAGKSGYSPIARAVFMGNMAGFNAFLEYDTNLINCDDEELIWLYEFAIFNKQPKMAAIFFENILANYLYKHQYTSLIKLVEKEKHNRTLLNLIDSQGLLGPILFELIKRNETTITVKLIELNILNINMSDENDSIPLHYAAKNNNLSLVKCLIKHGSYLSIVNADDDKPSQLTTDKSIKKILSREIKSRYKTDYSRDNRAKNSFFLSAKSKKPLIPCDEKSGHPLSLKSGI